MPTVQQIHEWAERTNDKMRHIKSAKSYTKTVRFVECPHCQREVSVRFDSVGKPHICSNCCLPILVE